MSTQQQESERTLRLKYDTEVYRIRDWREEGYCPECGSPVMAGDRAYFVREFPADGEPIQAEACLCSKKCAQATISQLLASRTNQTD